jgi:hypothetical protein
MSEDTMTTNTEAVPNTLAGFKSSFFDASRRPLNEQDIFDAGVRSGLARGADVLGDAARDIITERQRQMSVEGWTPEHDDAYLGGDLAGAAACYCLGALGLPYEAFENFWPWDEKWWKPTNHRRDLIKAAALILAEIERIDRADPSSSTGDQEVGS